MTFMQGQTAINHQMQTQMDRMSTQLNQVVTSLQVKEKGAFSAQPLTNPKGQYEVGCTSDSIPQVHVQVVTTLRSCKVIQKDVPPKVEKPKMCTSKEEQSSPKGDKEEKES